ncbi:hypothetical protein [Paenibacillus gansuensis]|uniref:Uncharacterized protein n=1 Tax=Paenibacillus gansuensis TaxID=306542 RepID=A0ABW5PMC3_9BACL
MNTLQRLEKLQDKRVKITMKDGAAFICEPLQIVFDDELETYQVYIVDGMSSHPSDIYAEVYVPDIASIEEIS